MQFLTEYARAVCAMYEPCCRSEDQGYDEDGCVDWFRAVTAAYFQGEYQPQAGMECLQALDSVVEAEPGRCNDVPLFDKATLREQCRKAFAAAPQEGAELGGECLLASDCARHSSDDGDVICYGGSCVLQRRGSVGDGPCYLAGLEGAPTEIVVCEPADDLYCSREDDVCAPRVDAGELCPNATACRESALCNGGLCERLPDPGEACLNGVPGAGGFCRAGSACDVETLVCGPGLDEGEPCRESLQCVSGLCDGGVCVRSDFTSHLNCTGG